MNPPIEHDPHEDTLFGHPKGLFVLFAAEMWERFCYYGMRALLTLYLTKALLMGDAVASGIYGAYTALVYAAPVLGGRIADRLLGYRKAIIFGGILMAIGEFVLLGATEMTLYAGMGLIIVGNGYFKANISTVVGRLYRDGDERRDSGFTIFYLGINLGALLATTVCAWVGETYGYHYGFGLAGVGMLIGIGAFIFGLPLLQGHGLPPDETYLHEKVFGVSRQNLTYLASIAAAPLLYFVLQQHHFVEYLHTLDIPAINAVIAFMDPLDYALWGIWLLVNGKLIQNALRESDGGVLLHRTYALIILQVFNIVFWACFEQAGTSLTLFADRNVDRAIGSWVMPASMTQSANSFFIVAFAGFFSALWLKLDRLNINPNIPMKFGLGIIQAGLGYLLLIVGGALVGPDALVPLWIVVFMYMLHTTGELFLSPIGLSMVTKLAPKTMTGTVMGAWFLSFSLSNKVAGKLAGLTGSGEGGVETADMTPIDSLTTYLDVFGTMGYVLVAFGVFVALLSRPINRLMHGVR